MIAAVIGIVLALAATGGVLGYAYHEGLIAQTDDSDEPPPAVLHDRVVPVPVGPGADDDVDELTRTIGGAVDPPQNAAPQPDPAVAAAPRGDLPQECYEQERLACAIPDPSMRDHACRNAIDSNDRMRRAIAVDPAQYDRCIEPCNNMASASRRLGAN